MHDDDTNDRDDTQKSSAKSGLSRRDVISAAGALAAAGLGSAVLTAHAKPGNGNPPPFQTQVFPKYYPLDSFSGDVSVHGQTIIITGASRGIGLATGLALQAKGATVIGTSRTPGIYEAHPFPLLQLDVADPVSVGAFPAAVAVLTGGSIDALINNAGRFVFGTPVPIPPIDPVFYHQQIAVAMATLYLGHVGVTNGLLGIIKPGGAVMFTVSIAGYAVGGTEIGEATGLSFLSSYLSGKRALLAYANGLRGFLRTAGFPIRVATVNPAAINTQLADFGVPIVLDEAVDDAGVPSNPTLALVMQGNQQFLGGGLPPEMVAETYCQLLEASAPTPNVVVASPEEPLATQGGNEFIFAAALAENEESAVPFAAEKNK